MAKPVAFSRPVAERVLDVTRIVEREGPRLTGSPPGSTSRPDCWLRVTATSATLSTNRWRYQCDVYTGPGLTYTKLSEARIAYNANELEATGGAGGGYSFVTSSPECGDVTSLASVTSRGPRWVKCQGKTIEPSGATAFWFHIVNTPNVQGPE